MSKFASAAALTALLCAAGCASAPPAPPSFAAPGAVVLGEPPGFRIEGLVPRESARVHALRQATRTVFENGQRLETPVILHAWADFIADRRGRIDTDSAQPERGTYEGADFNGLLWSGYAGDSGAAIPPGAGRPASADELSLAVERGGAVIAAQTVQLKAYRDDIEIEAVEAKDAGISGSFAYPTGASRLPALVLLHGSEGAIRDASRRWAARMAQQGYAAFALHYVAYGWNDGGIDGVSPYFADVPLDLIEKTRAFLASRPEADAERFGVLGVSKGAEFALSAAAREPFIDAVVACVPSDVVWAGFGREVAPGEEISSWSWRGVPLKAIQYDRYEDVFSGAATATEVHRRSRAKAGPEVVAAAAIPAEAVTAQTLLIGGGEDETWPSAEMAQAVEARMAAAGRGDRVTTLVFPEAGHGICGTGAAPERINGETNAAANARANTESYRATREFLKRVLSR